MAACPGYQRSRPKERHDRVLYIMGKDMTGCCIYWGKTWQGAVYTRERHDRVLYILGKDMTGCRIYWGKT